ncbi:MAG: hypothetical protein HY482_01700 [Candidatus Wildermuthbacteria bacterium]|nr:hypothetical protein [Candidatus Wildermuthbacteria bacterium]
MKNSFLNIIGIVLWISYFYFLLTVEDKFVLGLISGIVIGGTILGVILVIRGQEQRKD